MTHWIHTTFALGLYHGLSWTIGGVSVSYAMLAASRLVPAKLRRRLARRGGASSQPRPTG